MSRFMSPSKDQLDGLNRRLLPYEQAVLEFFDSELPAAWEIFIKPHLNGLRPIFVLLNPDVGIAIFDVWSDLESANMPEFTRNRGDVPLLPREKQNLGSLIRGRAKRQKQELLDLFCPRLGAKLATQKNAYAVVTSGAIFTDSSDFQVSLAFGTRLKDDAIEKYYPFSGKDSLVAGNIDYVFPESIWKTSKFMNDGLADDLRFWLYEPDHVSEQRERLTFNPRQKELVTTRTESGYRRIKGSAGSGKSMVLAARAAELAMDNKDVLVITYNITLINYIRDLAYRYPDPGKGMTNRITWRYFHSWCRRVCEEAGVLHRYSDFWGTGTGLTDDHQLIDGQLDSAHARDLPALISSVISEFPDRITKYDAILVDEGQDFYLEWWSVLRQVLRDKGEALLVADSSQDIYGTASAWTDDAMNGAGFSGAWTQLEGSYRIPETFVPLLQEYVSTYLNDLEVNMPTAVQLTADGYRQSALPTDTIIEPVRLKWVQTSRDCLVDAGVSAVRDISSHDIGGPLSIADVTYLTNSHSIGRECSYKLNDHGLQVAHIFDEDRSNQRAQKMAFFMGDDRIKGCTIHSFKGWESRALVVIIENVHRAENRALLYVAMSRLKRSSKGSALTVVCAAPEMATFGRKWPEFATFADEAVPF